MSKPLVHVNDSRLAALLGADAAKRTAALRSGVALIVMREPGKSTVTGIGTGTLISDDLVMTAGHVVSGFRQFMAAKFTGKDANDDTLMQVRFNVAFTAATAGKKRHANPDADLEPQHPRYDVKKVEEIFDNISTTGTEDFALLRIARSSNPPPSDRVIPHVIQRQAIDNAPAPQQPNEQPTSSVAYAAHFGNNLFSLQHPHGEPLQATVGPIKLLNQVKDDFADQGPLHFVDMLSERGSSGAPIFDDGGVSASGVRQPDKIIGILLGSSPKNKGTLTRVMPMDAIFRQSSLLRALLKGT